MRACGLWDPCVDVVLLKVLEVCLFSVFHVRFSWKDARFLVHVTWQEHFGSPVGSPVAYQDCEDPNWPQTPQWRDRAHGEVGFEEDRRRGGVWGSFCMLLWLIRGFALT